MSVQPSAIARDAKGIQTSLKELLKTKDSPFDREIDFQRKDLRRRYLSLLLVHPDAKESENVETHLWIQTSYAFISDYKQRLARIDRSVQRQPPQGQQKQSNQSRQGPVEYRKLLQRFRQFLAEEDKFWTQFVVRYYRSFSLDEAHPVLVTLGILSETAVADEALQTNGRNLFQFPPSTSFIPATPADRETRLNILSKALVCLGDIARYREQYNEGGGRPRIGSEEGPRKRTRRGGALVSDIPRPRNYERARSCYEQAKFLTPHDGNPSHQLAILATYEMDSFASLVHYYRSLCVKNPYETASDNMGSLLSKTFEHWSSNAEDDIPSDIAHVPKVLIEEFKKRVLILHALWWSGRERNDQIALKEAENIANKFYSMVSERNFPTDFITQLVALAQGALWKVRMLQDTSSIKSRPRPETSSVTLPSTVIEARIYTHLLSLYRGILEVGIDQLKEPQPLDSETDLAQRLIAAFRRTLPALRVAGKWLRANYKYVMSDPEAQGVLNTRGKAKDIAKVRGAISPLSTETIDFWTKYAEFLRALSRTFPADRLPDLRFPLPEDIEMRGFKPLKAFMNPQKEPTGTEDGVPQKESEVHPNDVELMRIKDIFNDAKALVEMENSPLAIYGNQFVVRGVESQVQPIPTILPLHSSSMPLNSVLSLSRNVIPRADLEDDAMTELTSNTDDSVLRDAFGHLDDKDDGDDEVVWDPKPSAPPDPSPVLAPLLASHLHVKSSSPSVTGISPISPISPSKLLESPSRSNTHSHVSPGPALAPRVAKTTAEDLLKRFMSPGPVSAARMTSDPLVPRSPLLFDRPGTSSIWTASQDEQTLRYSAGTSQAVHSLTPQTRQHNLSASQDLSSQQSIWSYSNSQNSQHHLAGALPSASFAAHSSYSVGPDPNHPQLPSVDAHPSSLMRDYGSGQNFPSGAPHLVHHNVGMLPTSYLHTPSPYFEPASGSLYDTIGTPQNFRPHTRHLSFHDPSAFASQAMPSMSSIWGNNG